MKILIITIFLFTMMMTSGLVSEIEKDDGEWKVNGAKPKYKVTMTMAVSQKFIYKTFGIFSSVMAAFSLSLVLALWAGWIARHFGWAPALLWSGALCSDKWLMILGQNYYHLWFASFLPIISVFWAYEKKWDIGLVVFLTILLKLVLSNVELFFPVALSVFVPLVFYSVNRRMPIKKIIEYFLITAFSVALAFGVGLYLVKILFSSCSIKSFLYWIHFAKYDLWRWGPNFREVHFHNPNPITPQNLFSLIWHQLLITRVLFIPLWVFIAALIPLGFARKSWHQTALYWSVVASLFCSLSWVLIMQSHTAIHMKIDSFCWELPFMPMLLLLLTALFFKKREIHR